MNDLDHNHWHYISEFVEAGGCATTQEAMAFRLATAKTREKHGSPNESSFNRALFKYLKSACKLGSFNEVAEKFMFDPNQIPFDEQAESPEVVSELSAADRDRDAALAKVAEADSRKKASLAMINRLDELKSDLVQMRETLTYLESFPEEFRAEIVRCEQSVIDNVYSMPKYSQIGNSVNFVLGREERIAAANAALASHEGRIAGARAKVAALEKQIATISKAPKKSWLSLSISS